MARRTLMARRPPVAAPMDLATVMSLAGEALADNPFIDVLGAARDFDIPVPGLVVEHLGMRILLMAIPLDDPMWARGR